MVPVMCCTVTASVEPRAANTLYSAQTLGPAQLPTNVAVVVYRTYVPDAGLGPTAGAGLPHIVFNNANGTRISGLPSVSMPQAARSWLF